MTLLVRAAAALALSDPDAKVDAVHACYADWQAGMLPVGASVMHGGAGFPARPELVEPDQLRARKLGSLEGRAAMIHAVCHIEFNAINLALDALCRFPFMPVAYLDDWLRVADEEASHFAMMRNHLRSLGFEYGDFPAHRGLWDMAEKTQGDVLDRMAMVPRLMEARGLDVTPGMQARLLANGDAQAAALLDIIFRDEVGHVTVGNRWFRYLCAERGLDPIVAFRERLRDFDAPRHPGVMNVEARLKAGFEQAELDILVSWQQEDVRVLRAERERKAALREAIPSAE
ncbi:ferritin-like domain-containing protein [Burkholderiaceae bacterium DAT-1]|nr:ferritin-like domain-containing protein [Burkholderiaceae bacterium DAT-1]